MGRELSPTDPAPAPDFVGQLLTPFAVPRVSGDAALLVRQDRCQD
jgi:hypothetical protein